MSDKNISLNLEQLGMYLAAKQSLIEEYKGINYSHAIAIIRDLMFFKHPESLYARMKIYSPSLINSLIENRFLVQAPFFEGKLIYVAKGAFPFFYYYFGKNAEYKHPLSKQVLDYINQEGIVKRSKIMEHFRLSRSEVMEILTELRSQFKIIMYYNNINWLIYSSNLILNTDSMSKTTALTNLVYWVIKCYGPITIPQIISMLHGEGGKISTSIIELYEKKVIVKGNFVENALYETFISSDELEKLDQFLKNKPKDSNLVILPSSDPLVQYWQSAAFFSKNKFHDMVIFEAGLPICSFDYKVENEKLHIINFTKTPLFAQKEERLLEKLREFAENMNKIAILPQLESELLKKQAQSFVKILGERGYTPANYGLSFGYRRGSTGGEKVVRYVNIGNLIPFLLEMQYLAPSAQFSTWHDVVYGLKQIGIPLPRSSFYARIKKGKERLLDEMIVQRDLLYNYFGQFRRGLILSEDYDIFAKLVPPRYVGVLEERVFKAIKQKEKITLDQLKSMTGLSEKVLMSALIKLEKALLVVERPTLKGRMWFTAEAYLKNKRKNIKLSQKEAWMRIIERILSTNLPLTLTQLANVTGLSNTQVEIYLKELIASREVRTGKYIEDINAIQFTTKNIENKIAGYVMAKDEEKNTESRKMELVYVPHSDHVLTLYRDYMAKRFNLRSLLLHPMPTEYADLIMLNGNPFAAIHFKVVRKVMLIQNIELLPEYTSDNYTLMLLITKLKEYLSKFYAKGQLPPIKNINGIPLSSSKHRELRNLLKEIDY
ncbi:MAG: hypothetical protein ACTSUF_12200 [Candidatus Heimdallarchaeaceae archaeon]